LIAVGTRMPAWVEQGMDEYSKRLPREIRLDIREIPLAGRGKDLPPARAKAVEAEAILRAIPDRDRVIALDVGGRQWSTEQLAGQLANWQMSAQNYSLVIGGPEGIASDLLARADLRWSLSPLTLPHPLVRIVLLEQLYRAWTINNNHPYHRA
jgi:23S rRNA (pseudouridine1915-N3)-methyltransferase